MPDPVDWADSVEQLTDCKHCGQRIAWRYNGTFWKDGPMPAHWVHVLTNTPVCFRAEPRTRDGK